VSSLTLKPLKSILAMSKQAVDDMLAGVRARQTKARAEVELAKLDERAITLEREIQELCAQAEIDFTRVMSKMDDFDVNERRKTQLRKIVAELFPTEE
jgi:uncharacterized protein involved in exopolysaccharide biosynthesis